MNIVITGAGGFLGRALAAHARAAWTHPADRFLLLDRAPAAASPDDRTRAQTGDLRDLRPDDVWLAEADIVFHLAAVAGGAAEREPDLAKAVNLDATLHLLDCLAHRSRPVRLVYASTIAVFGAPLPAHIDDDTAPYPAMIYGAHKLMIETALADYARRGKIDGVALRLPGIVARPSGDTTMRSAFLSELFHACAQHRSFVVPVSAEAAVWLMSVSCAVHNLLHAAQLPPAVARRAFTLPALRTTLRQLVAALVAQTGSDPRLVTYSPDPALEAQFGRLPTLGTPAADGMGFRHDGDLAALCARALGDDARAVQR